jgi:hypothetical protein
LLQRSITAAGDGGDVVTELTGRAWAR